MTNLPGRDTDADAVTFAASQTIDFDDGLYNHKKISAMTAQWSPTFAASTRRGIKTFVLKQHASSGFDVVWPGNVDWQGADPQPIVFGGAETIYTLYWNGSNYIGMNARTLRVLYEGLIVPVEISPIDTWVDVVTLDAQILPMQRGDLIMVNDLTGATLGQTTDIFESGGGTAETHVIHGRWGHEVVYRVNSSGVFQAMDTDDVQMDINQLKIIRT